MKTIYARLVHSRPMDICYYEMEIPELLSTTRIFCREAMLTIKGKLPAFVRIRFTATPHSGNGWRSVRFVGGIAYVIPCGKVKQAEQWFYLSSVQEHLLQSELGAYSGTGYLQVTPITLDNYTKHIKDNQI